MPNSLDDSLPSFLRPFFWDIEFDQLRLPGRESYVIERLLEFGDDQAVRWLRATFPDELIGHVVRTSRRISPNTANLWSLVFDIPREAIACFSTPSLLMLDHSSSDLPANR